ncbi:MAG: Na+/H+ antiporter [Ktedonobacterales bacterium]|nr:Na+/H+ antiporter [Ktedonobacterales bacterium]
MPETTVGVFLTLLIIVVLVAAVVRRLHIPASVALVVVGGAIAFVPGVPSFVLSPGIILTLFLPVLLFHGAYRLDLRDVRRNLVVITTLAFPGVLLTAALVGLALHVVAQLPWLTALLFGAIVAATDPVAVLALFGEVGAPRRLAAIVTGESLFNDGTALVVFATLLSTITGHVVTPLGVTEQVLIEVVGGIALGIGVGILGGLLLARFDDALLETAVTLILAYGGYLLATAIGSSGPLETVTAALTLGARGRRVMSPTTRVAAGATWEFLDFLANSLLFLLVGLQLRPIAELSLAQGAPNLVWQLLGTILAVVLARMVVVGLTVGVLILRRTPLPAHWGRVLVWAGLRGAVSLAAALSLPLAYPDRALLLTLTFGIVLFTLLVQGLTLAPLLTRWGILAATATTAFEVAWGRVQMLIAAQHELVRFRQEARAATPTLDALEAQYTTQLQEQQQILAECYTQNATLVQEEAHTTQLHLLRVQREAVREAGEQGRLSSAALHTVLDDLDAQVLRAEDPARSRLDAVMGETYAEPVTEEPA